MTTPARDVLALLPEAAPDKTTGSRKVNLAEMARAPLIHWTRYSEAFSIIHYDSLGMGPYVSFTRNPYFRFGSIALVFDQDKLRQHYRCHPYDYFRRGGKARSQFPPKLLRRHDFDPSSITGRREDPYEAEERCYLYDAPIAPLRRYLLSIHIHDRQDFDQWAEEQVKYDGDQIARFLADPLLEKPVPGIRWPRAEGVR